MTSPRSRRLVIAGGVAFATLAGVVMAGAFSFAIGPREPTTRPAASAVARASQSARASSTPAPPSPTPEPSRSAAPSRTAVPSAAAGCFREAASATPAPSPSGEAPENADLEARLPASAFGEPLEVSTASGPWVLADRFWAGSAAGYLACTKHPADDLWVGWASGSHLLGYAVVAYEIEGVSGGHLLDITIRDFFGADPPAFHSEIHEGREYWTTDGASALYATDRTFYLITAYCCVDLWASPGPLPSGEEIVQSLLEGLPANE